MANTLTATPNSTYNNLSDYKPFKLTISPISSGNQQFKPAWQLYDVTEAKDLTEPISEEAISTSEEIIIDPRYEIQGRLKTKIPELITDATQIDDMFMKEIALKHGQVTIDTDDCNNNTIVVGDQSPAYKYFNSFSQFNEEIQSGAIKLFNHLPVHSIVSRDALNWIWVWGTGNIDIVITKKDGSTVNGIRAINTTNVIMFGIGPEQIIKNAIGLSVDDVCKYSIQINSDYYYFYVRDNPISSFKRMDLFFLDPLGGYSLIEFKTVEKIDVQKTFEEICVEGNYSDFADIATFGGRTPSNIKSWTKYTLTKKVNIKDSNIDYYLAFGRSSHFLARPIGTTYSTQRLSSFIVASSNVPVFQKGGLTEIKVTGYFQNFDGSHKFI